MLERILPREIDAGYAGHPVARFVLLLITLMTLGRSLVHILRADGGAQSIATIPLDRFTGAGADAVVFVFALWGLSQLLLGLVYAAVWWRYPALIPCVYVLFITEYLGRAAIGWAKPLLTLETPPGAVGNVVLPVLGVAMLWLSLRRPGERAAPPTPATARTARD